MLDRALVAHASPTLARLKLGSLFTFSMGEGFQSEYSSLRAQLSEKGVTLTVLRRRKGIALLYLYREDMLARALERADVWAFLKTCGYVARDVDGVLATLRDRLEASACFPHEIGVFLGYPLEDVIGFIENEGRNCLCNGCWKVYANECDALRAFACFRKCKTVYERLFASGCPLTRLTVAARPA